MLRITGPTALSRYVCGVISPDVIDESVKLFTTAGVKFYLGRAESVDKTGS